MTYMTASAVQFVLMFSLGCAQAESRIPKPPIMQKKPVATDFYDTHPFPRLPHGVSDRPVVIEIYTPERHFARLLRRSRNQCRERNCFS